MNQYTVTLNKPESHLVEITVHVDRLDQNFIDFTLPAWSPGSYLIRDYSKNVVKVEAFDRARNPLSLQKLDKSTWRVDLHGQSECKVVYQVYCHEISTHSSFVDNSHATLQGPDLYLYPQGKQDEPCKVTLKFPSSWKTISTGLTPLPHSRNTFSAPDYDALIDTPIEIGNHAIYRFTVRGVPHDIALYGKGNLNPKQLVTDVQQIVEHSFPIFRDLPYSHYVFIMHLLPGERGGGGLEHRNSTVIQMNRWKFLPEEEYRKKLSLIAHEYFHLWNVKRLAPKPLVNFDYTTENYTDLLWMAEGFTSYYEDLILVRAKLLTPTQYFETVCEDYKFYLESPGREIQSLCESSFDSWTKFYGLREGARNLTISYYQKGALVGLGLDLLIRKATQGHKSLDDVMRHLYQETFVKVQTGYDLNDLKKTSKAVAKISLDNFFSNYVEGHAELPLGDWIKPFGLRLVPKEEKPISGYFGIEIRKEENRPLIGNVPWNTPAHKAGFCAGDEIVAFDGMKVSLDSLPQRIKESKPGSVHRVHVFRLEEMLEIPITVGEKPKSDWRIDVVKNASASIRKQLTAWLGSFPDSKGSKDSHPKQAIKKKA